MSSLFQETCKVLSVHKVNTSSDHTPLYGVIERWHRSLYTGLSHIKSANNNWDVLVPFSLWLTKQPHIPLLNTAPFTF